MPAVDTGGGAAARAAIGDKLLLRRIALTVGILLCFEGLSVIDSDRPATAPTGNANGRDEASDRGRLPRKADEPETAMAEPQGAGAQDAPAGSPAAPDRPQITEPSTSRVATAGDGGSFNYSEPWELPVPAASGADAAAETVQMHPRVNFCRGIDETSPEVAGGTDLSGIALGCFADVPVARAAATVAIDDDGAGVAGCLAACAKQGRSFAAVTPAGGGLKCGCADGLGARADFKAPEHGTWQRAPAADSLDRCRGVKAGFDGTPASAVFRVGPWPPPGALGPTTRFASRPRPVITVFVWANPRLAAMFRTCRLSRMSTRFDYEVFDLRHQVRNANKQHVAALLARFPGPKVIVFDGCCVPGWLIMQWPSNALLVVASDESANWGFGDRKHTWGPHGPDGEVPSDANRTIVLPAAINPWFKQYYSARHVAHFGSAVRYIPLGSREEFADAPPDVKPPSLRRYLCSFMGAPTDDGRKKLRDIMAADTTLPKARVFVHVADHWDADPNSERSTYVKPEQYRSIMLDSVFTLCPRGHSIEQFRLYEAIESGSIPILAREGYCPGGCPGYAEERLPPEYFDSPMVFVQDWEEVVGVVARLDANHTALLEQQMALRAWYARYTHAKVEEIEASFGSG